jgi:hypothetical protein
MIIQWIGYSFVAGEAPEVAGLNSNLCAMTGQTAYGVKCLSEGQVDSGWLTFFKSWVPSIPDLQPNILHRLWSADVLPMTEEEFDLDLLVRFIGLSLVKFMDRLRTLRTDSNAAVNGENTS